MPRRRDPMELMLLGLCLLSGLFYLAGAQPPSSVEQVMPGWLVWAWYASLTAAGGIGFAGNLWPGDVGTGLLVRLSGLLLASAAAAAFAIAAFSFAGGVALFGGGITFAWSLACLWKAKHITEDLKLVRGTQ